MIFLSLNRTFLQVTVTVPLYGFNALLTRLVSGSSNSLAFCRLNPSKQFIITSVLKINCWTVVVLPLISLTDISTMKQASPEMCGMRLGPHPSLGCLRVLGFFALLLILLAISAVLLEVMVLGCCLSGVLLSSTHLSAEPEC